MITLKEYKFIGRRLVSIDKTCDLLRDCAKYEDIGSKLHILSKVAVQASLFNVALNEYKTDLTRKRG